MTTITDQQRREIAARLRELRPCKPPLAPDSLCGLCEVVTEAVAPGTDLCEVKGRCPEKLGPLIADLIDRPTCHDESDNDEFFVCSVCGANADLTEFEIGNYCANCGAEVAE